LAGCATGLKPAAPPKGAMPGQPPSAPVPPASSLPTFEKTFGSVAMKAGSALSLQYKEMRLAVNPSVSAGPSTPDPLLDYLLSTDATPARLPSALQNALPKNLKIIATADGAERLRGAGFSQVKALAPGQRLMLQKEKTFVFVSAVKAKNPSSGLIVNGYLLEFDNGKNLFVAIDVTDMTALREFLYGLRDDGKEIHLAFFNGRAGQENSLGEIIALLQPRHAIVLPTSPAMDGKTLREKLQAEIFSGDLYLAPAGAEIPF
jgi:hypothetical protein